MNDHGSWGGEISDEQWVVLEPLLPKGTKAGRPPIWSRRQLIDGIRFRVRTGVPWRDVPAEYGPWGRIYDLFRRWQRNGTWHRVFSRLQSLTDAKGAITHSGLHPTAPARPATDPAHHRCHAPHLHWLLNLNS
ncbi:MULTISPECIES: transposase [unclassified Streptomyces]|nr:MULTISPECIES: transposase [unclassified Streptomyces]